MAIKRTYIQLQTAAATASFSYLRAPDVGSEYSDNKYKTTILINKAVAAAIRA